MPHGPWVLHLMFGSKQLLIVVQEERKDIDHLTITTRCPATVCLQTERGGAAQHLVLQLSEWDG